MYGDSGYDDDERRITPFSTMMCLINTAYAELNTCLSSARIAIEWFFGIASNKFRWLKLTRSAHPRHYTMRIFRVAIFLANIHDIFYPNQISQYFGVEPPTLDDYFGPLPRDE